jgi:radical SAM superfamily enzyme with C-terminal helix-hairpin-helix motif
MFNISIIDGYVDEPTCLGVPPYISPYPRYIAGAIWEYDHLIKINYITIDKIRKNNYSIDILTKSDLIIAIAGISVPGKYLGGSPASPFELVKTLNSLTKPIKLLYGPAAKYGFGIIGGKKTKEIDFVKNTFDLIIKGDAETIISELLENKLDINKVDASKCRKDASSIRDFAIKGTKIVNQHPDYPNHLITEIETYRGCPRTIVGGCSFCSEPSKGLPDFRPIKDIVDEIKALYENGVRHFRIGNQPCIFSYLAKDSGKAEFPKPNPDALEKLFKGIRNVAPDLKTLHIDNANPGIIARYPIESKSIAKTIIKYHTPGDVAAFGVESVDPIVIKQNNLKATDEEVSEGIKLINDVGSKQGYNGMPELLPGLNFVFGLKGETKETYKLNYEFLKKILENKLLVRRINLRQVIPITNTSMYEVGTKIIDKNKKFFKIFKRKIQIEIDKPMLKFIVPKDTMLKDVYTETYEGKLTFGRQMGSYPLLVGIPGIYPLNNFYDVKVIDYGFRSITALPYPLEINTASRKTIEAIPGIGKKRANRIILKRPFKDTEQLINALDEKEIYNEIKKYLLKER